MIYWIFDRKNFHPDRGSINEKMTSNAVRNDRIAVDNQSCKMLSIKNLRVFLADPARIGYLGESFRQRGPGPMGANYDHHYAATSDER